MRIALVLALLAAPAAESPNVVVILIDDLGWADVGCNGSTYYETPNVDRLAARGVRFTNGTASCPVCSPTRASLLTGKVPPRTGVTDWIPGRKDMPSQKLLRPALRNELALEETTVAEALQAAGYATGHFGKWHLGGEAFLPGKQGFDVNVGGTHAGSPAGGYFKFSTPTLKLGEGEHLDDRLAAEAVKFIRENKDRPFYLQLWHYTVHIPLQPKPGLLAKYEAKEKRGPQQNPVYAAMVESMDRSVGEILRALDELKLAERTIVVFTSDNGGLSVKEGPHTPATSNAPLRAGKGYLYEGGLRVPWIVAGPGIPARVSDVPVSSVDLFPTLLEAAGLKVPSGLDGVSLLPHLKGGAGPERDALFWHYPHYSNQGGRPGGAVRAGTWKLIEHYEDGRLEIFDLAKDPGEADDRAAAEPARAAELRRRLEAWRQSVGAKMPTPNPDYKGS
jgi:arylsulfatase A-like enzyme